MLQALRCDLDLYLGGWCAPAEHDRESDPDKEYRFDIADVR